MLATSIEHPSKWAKCVQETNDGDGTLQKVDESCLDLMMLGIDTFLRIMISMTFCAKLYPYMLQTTIIDK